MGEGFGRGGGRRKYRGILYGEGDGDGFVGLGLEVCRTWNVCVHTFSRTSLFIRLFLFCGGNVLVGHLAFGGEKAREKCRLAKYFVSCHLFDAN